MGALRVAELAPYGMIGNGAVFEMYRDGVIEADDEVAVAHGDGPEYKRFSEPLVNLRTALAAACQSGTVTAPEATAIAEFAQGQPYTARTWQGIERGTQGMGGVPQAVGRVRAFLAEHPEHADIEAADALDTLSRLGDITTQHGTHDMTWSRSPHWKHRYLYEWTVNFAGCSVGDVRAEFGSIIRYRQIYDRDFPRRWRAFALRQMLSAHGVPAGDLTVEQVEDRMVSLAAEKGLDGASLTAEQASEWLLEDVERDLPARERLCRVLARSFRPARGIHDLLTAEPDLVRDEDARRAVVESYVVNTTIDGWGPKHSVHHIKGSLLRDHLAGVWQLSDGDGDGDGDGDDRVVAVPDAAGRGRHAGIGEALGEPQRGILTALVAMMDQLSILDVPGP
jgi:hypothetical protein